MPRYEVSLDELLVRLIEQGHGAVAVRPIEEAVAALATERADFGVDDLYESLARLGHPEVTPLVQNAIITLREPDARSATAIARWIDNGRVPFADGYGEARWHAIRRAIEDGPLVRYGYDDSGIDDRIVEYPWVFDRLDAAHPRGGRVLDAGSVMNHPQILRLWDQFAYGPLSMVTLAFEGQAFVSDLCRYEFADLRELPYRDGWFDSVMSLSTIEHVGMDTTIYGGTEVRAADPRADVTRVLQEFRRVLRPGGLLLLSFPYGEPSDRGWQRVIGHDETLSLANEPGWDFVSTRVFRSLREGWRETTLEDAACCGCNEDRGGLCTAPEWVAGGEAVALMELRRGA